MISYKGNWEKAIKSHKISDKSANKLICFGAGKMLGKYASSDLFIKPVAVLDNYQSGTVAVENLKIPVISIDQLIEEYQKDSIILLITTRYFSEALNQLDSIDELDGLMCYTFEKSIPSGVVETIRRRRKYSLAESKKEIRHYFLCEETEEGFQAGTKAPQDIEDILKEIGYCGFNIHLYQEENRGKYNWDYMRTTTEWDEICNRIEEKSILILQHPLRVKQTETMERVVWLKKRKHIKIISIVHDVEELRYQNCPEWYIEERRYMSQIADFYIVHNEKMKKFFVKEGVDEKKVICLGAFDYLCAGDTIRHREMKKSLVFAGYLPKAWAGFTTRFGEIGNLEVHLYGPDYEGQANFPNVEYHGVISSIRLPDELPDGFGLVWAGDSLETCSGDVGNYMRYNNPHKLSLYLAAGLPVVIWERAAAADFVIENHVGITVNSLFEAEKRIIEMGETEWETYIEAARVTGMRMRKGEYTKNAIKKATSCLNKLDR